MDGPDDGAVTGDSSTGTPTADSTGSADSSSGGSTDGGSTDGGSTDGGSTDGGSTDGGSTDGGSTDGGSTDGGSTDGGSTDGGSTDGGSTDGGSTDGGMGCGMCTADEEVCSDALGECVSLFACEAFSPTLDLINQSNYSIVSSVGLSDAGGVLTLDVGCTGLAYDPVGGDLYIVVKDDLGTRHLGTVDTATGDVTVIGALSDVVASIAFDAGGTLYGLTGQGAATSNAVFSINTADATMTLELDVADDPLNTDGETLAYDPADGLLYRWSGNGDPKLYSSVDIGGLTETVLAPSFVPSGEVVSGTVIPGGALAGRKLITTRDQEAISIQDDGTYTNEGAFVAGNGYYKGLAFAPAN